jgi:hypothetical protein
MANRPWLNKKLSRTHRRAISKGLKRFNASKKWSDNVKIDLDQTRLHGEKVTPTGLTATEAMLNINHIKLRLAIQCLETALELLKCR